MRIARLLAVLFLILMTSSTALAATKVVKFGKLVDGTGRVVTNAVVIVEDDRVQRVTTGNVAMPNGAEVIGLRRLTAPETHLANREDPLRARPNVCPNCAGPRSSWSRS